MTSWLTTISFHQDYQIFPQIKYLQYAIRMILNMLQFKQNKGFLINPALSGLDHPQYTTLTIWLWLLPLTCAACTGGPLRASTWAHIPVQRCLWRGQHPTVTEGGCGCCQGLATKSPSRLVHGIRIGYRHCHVHGEVLLRQCCGLQERDKHTDI